MGAEGSGFAGNLQGAECPGGVLISGARHLCRFIGQSISWREAG